jgi:membrane protease YdiL (CAAX protease family)
MPADIAREKAAMSSTVVAASADTAREPIAPAWHTALVLLCIAAVSLASWYQHGLPNAHLPGMSARLSSYVTVLFQEWFIVLLIWLALRRRRISLGSLVSGRWQTPAAFFRDAALAVGFLVVVIPLIGILAHLLGAEANGSLENIPPKTVSELVVWLACAATAGFCEELVFRGYLARQFSAWTGSIAIAIMLQGVIFGLAHGFYGMVMIAVMVQGCLLGLLAYWRKSLLPGMLAHGLQDGVGGVVAFFS